MLYNIVDGKKNKNKEQTLKKYQMFDWYCAVILFYTDSSNLPNSQVHASTISA